jgi:hypothetical protein
VVFRVISAPSQTLISWWDDKSDIDLDPIYQRKGQVWSEKQRQALVDTVLNGFDIPKLYFADFSLLDSGLNPNRKKYAVIDGKQRMLALFGFFEGEFTLSKEFLMFENLDLRLGGLAYKDLVSSFPKIARKFENASLPIMSVITDDEQKINELFIRLNTSKPLVGAEIRNAMLGEVPNLIRKLAEHPFWGRTRFNKSRGQDKNAAAKLLLLEHAGTFIDTKKRQLDNLVIDANKSTMTLTLDDLDIATETELESMEVTAGEVADAALDAENTDIGRSADRVSANLDLLVKLFIDKDPVLAQQALIPVIYWLARESKPSTLTALRPFLLKFEEERTINRVRPAEETLRDLELNDFELLARSSNDQQSISKRYSILRERFEKFYGTFT